MDTPNYILTYSSSNRSTYEPFVSISISLALEVIGRGFLFKSGEYADGFMWESLQSSIFLEN